MNFDFIPFLEVEILVGNITPPPPLCAYYILEKTNTQEGLWMVKAFIQNLMTFYIVFTLLITLALRVF